MKTFEEVMKSRRSYYGIEKKSPIHDEEIIRIIEQAILHTPTAFNMQSSKAILLLNDKHDQLWDITMNILQGIVPPAAFVNTKAKIESFQQGYGSILYFDDETITNTFANNNATYKDNFPLWAQQSVGMLQYNIWCMLEEKGFGCSLQHYNPLIDKQVHEAYNVPDHWKLIAEMPFGMPTITPPEKVFTPLDERFKICR